MKGKGRKRGVLREWKERVILVVEVTKKGKKRERQKRFNWGKGERDNQ